jgi:4-nitrophenyl phosphatase
VIGMAGLEAELASEGISYVGGTAPEDNTLGPLSLSDFRNDPDIGAVLCGLDMNINYTKLSKAFQYLRLNDGCLFLAANTDSTGPVKGGLLLAAGSFTASLQYALKRDPVSIGKPGPTMLDCIKAK